MRTDSYAPPDNPFATRAVRPGAIEYLFPSGDSAEAMLDRLDEHGGWGEITGPHGAGKSTLLATLLPRIETRGKSVVFVALHDGQRRLPSALQPCGQWNRGTQVVVDGYEQLGWRARRRLRRDCRRAGCGLLVTAHRSMGFPPLASVQPRLEAVVQLVDALIAGGPVQIAHDEVAGRFAAHGGDVRETLFDLYDLYEQRRPRN